MILAFSDNFDFRDDDLVIQGHKLRLPSHLNVVDVNSAKVDEKSISEGYEKFLQEYKLELEGPLYEVFFGSNNNLYTNHLTLFKWIKSIENHLNDYEINEIIITDMVKDGGYAPYYEAEGEAHARLLYKPYDFIPYVIYSYLRGIDHIRLNTNIIVHRFHAKWKRALRIFARRDILLFAKFGFFFIKLLTHKMKRRSADLRDRGDTTSIFFSRSVAHFDGINLLHRQIKGSRVFCGEGVFTFGQNLDYSRGKSNSCDGFIDYLNFIDLFSTLLSLYSMRYRNNRSKELSIDGVKYSFGSASVEMLIANYEVELYRISCERYLKQYIETSGERLTLFTCEMYTPFAKVVADLGSKYAFLTVQVQTTNMFVIYEPEYIFCDYFLFSSQSLFDSYCEKYPGRSHRVRFYGNYTEEMAKDLVVLERKGNIKRLLYFTQPLTDEDLEQEIIECLCSNSKAIGYEVLIKLHPRDSIDKLKRFKDRCKIVPSSVDFSRYMEGVDLAILKTSSIATKVVLAGVPIVYCLFSEWARNGALEYIDHDYIGTTYDAEELANILGQYDILKGGFREYRSNYIRDNGLDLGVAEVVQSLRELEKQ